MQCSSSANTALSLTFYGWQDPPLELQFANRLPLSLMNLSNIHGGTDMFKFGMFMVEFSILQS